ncbi:MAG: DUF2752 domain-containing protein, partial [Clostridia bacterium]|nr:DUF2752 domain-containing protein [Clostridia bacterium]
MVSLWYNIKNADSKKRHTLHSISVGFAFFLILFVLTKIFSESLCPFKRIFGIPCFGCGMTRGFISILNFDFKSAFKYNALSIPLFAGIAFYFLFSLTDIIFNKKYVYAIEK